MRCTFEININVRRTAKRLAMLLLLFCLIAVLIISGTVIMSYAGHEHDHNGVHGGCAACAQIQSAENLLKQLCVIIGGAMSAFAAVSAAGMVIKSVCAPAGPLTLAGLKTRMNN